MARVMNFNAGPGPLPLAALERAQAELLDLSGTGMSVMEHSHRGKAYEAVHDEALSLLRELLSIPASHDVLFVQGGASQLFAQVAMNLLPRGGSADHVVNGVWGEKAHAEAQVVAAMLGGTARLAASTGTGDGKEKAYERAAKQAELYPDPKAAYLHFTSNETVHGVQYGSDAARPFPVSPGVPLVCDMSSDFLSRPIDVSRFGLIYAGAQKNIGPSGLVVVIADKGLIEQGRKDIPKVFQLRTAAENRSLYNTPPTFGVYMVRNVLSWLKEQGGLTAMAKLNAAKAERVYRAIDASPQLFRGPVERESRSQMNVVFRLPDEAAEKRFVAESEKAGMFGLKGHRSVGGMRASLYNAVPMAQAEALAAFMDDFARRNG